MPGLFFSGSQGARNPKTHQNHDNVAGEKYLDCCKEETGRGRQNQHSPKGKAPQTRGLRLDPSNACGRR
jgi:hypothetical protein